MGNRDSFASIKWRNKEEAHLFRNQDLPLMHMTGLGGTLAKVCMWRSGNNFGELDLLLPPLHGVWGSNPDYQIYCWTTSPTLDTRIKLLIKSFGWFVGSVLVGLVVLCLMWGLKRIASCSPGWRPLTGDPPASASPSKSWDYTSL